MSWAWHHSTLKHQSVDFHDIKFMPKLIFLLSLSTYDQNKQLLNLIIATILWLFCFVFFSILHWFLGKILFEFTWELKIKREEIVTSDEGNVNNYGFLPSKAFLCSCREHIKSSLSFLCHVFSSHLSWGLSEKNKITLFLSVLSRFWARETKFALCTRALHWVPRKLFQENRWTLNMWVVFCA